MNKYYKFLCIVYLISVFSDCGTQKKIVGLWQIEKVSIEKEELTPVAKWTKLNKDNSQESGNGWMQHSVGTWIYDQSRREISITNTNGIKDEYGGFHLEFDQENMIWKRKEEGQNVQVVLKKINKIPRSQSNQLLGIWKLITKEENKLEDSKTYLHFRWDQILINKAKENIRKVGMYKTHGHKNELQVIYYEDPLRQEIWNFRIHQNILTLISSRNDNHEMKYERINYIPN